MAVTPAMIREALQAPAICETWQTRVEEWRKVYANDPVDVTFTTNLGRFSRDRLSLHMGSRVCEDWAGLTWGEQSEVTCDDEVGAELLSEVMGEEFRPRLLSNLEGAYGLGTSALVLIIEGMLVRQAALEAEGDIVEGASGLFIDTYDAPHVYPLRWERGKVKDCAFVSVAADGKTVDIQEHRDSGGYQTIRNRRFDVRGGRLYESNPDESVAPSVILEGAPPLFAIVRPSIRNTYDPKGPYGVSVLDRAMGAIDFLDTAFDRSKVDIELSDKMLFIDETLLRMTDDGEYLPPQSERRHIFAAMRGTGQMDTTPNNGMSEFNPNIRIDSYREAIDIGLSLVGEEVGMGAERYRYRGETIATATQIISENSSLFRQRRKHISELSAALTRIAEAVLWCGANLLGLGIGETEVIVKTDDSIIEDDTAIMDAAIREFSAGLMSKRRYLIEVKKMGEEEADEELARLEAEAPSVNLF